MALVKQIPTILNDSIKAVLGQNAPAEIDTNTFVSMGQKIAEMDLYDLFYKELVNRIVKTVYFIRSYNGNTRNILRDEHEYGAFIQKVYYMLPDASENPIFEVAQGALDGDTVTGYKQQSPYDIEQTIPVKSLVYGGKGAWALEVIRPVEQIKSAFLSYAAMQAFIDGLYTSINNRYELDVENLTNMAANTSIARCIADGRARNLLSEYNTATERSLTVSQALRDVEFLKFATQEIKQTIDNMQKMSTVFNGAKYATFTPRENLVVEVLSRFSSYVDTYLQSDTFHNELTALPRYESIPFWQGSGTAFAFEDVSAINIKNDGLNVDSHQTDTVNQTGIIAVLRDTENVAAYFSDRQTWELYNPRSGVMIHGENAQKGYAVDNFANSMVFYIAE